ncbi:MAG: NAD(P)/FAD-dependent oxidoreductase [Clostridia bacterium]|nr:NAD(P)/FAD-dependent oxidoreductase [Clostridia bacterium]MBQ8512916.1 NAD(P)/FAD-dependent oxidoreductase [Clostridia bacterium]
MVYDVLIVGAGCTGVMTARLLSTMNCTVAVAEAQCDVAMGATCANSAIVHAGYDAKPGTLKAKLNVRGNALMKELCRQLDVEINECGSHVVGFGEEDLAHLKTLYDRGVANGVPDMRIIGQEELRKMEPNISPEATCSLWAPSAAITCPYGITIAAAENAATNGVDFYFNFKVTGASRAGGIHYISNGEETIAARYVVNCAGVHSAELAEILGENDFPITIIPRRGEYIVMDKICGDMANSTLFVCPSERGKGILVSPTVHGNLLIGPNAYPIEDADDKSTTAEGLEEITTGALRLMPSVNTRNAITSFSGVRPTPNIYDFYLKNSEQVPGVVHAVGVESPGFAASPAVAEYLVSLLQDAGLELTEKDNYIPTRRADGNHKQFNQMTDEERTAACRADSSYGKIICRCETVTEGDIIDAINAPIPANTVDMLKKRLRAGMGRCQGGFCSPRVAALIAQHSGKSLTTVTKCGGGSWLVSNRTE